MQADQGNCLVTNLQLIVIIIIVVIVIIIIFLISISIIISISTSIVIIIVIVSLTNRFHVAVRLLRNISQMTCKCVKTRKCGSCVTDVLNHIFTSSVFCY